MFRDTFPSMDVLCVKCQFHCTVLYIFVLYIPPSVHLEEFELFFEAFEQIEFILGKHILIFGDFNIPHFSNDDLQDNKTNIINNVATLFNIEHHKH